MSTEVDESTHSPPLRFSTQCFPESASMKDESGLPWGCVIQPFNSLETIFEAGALLRFRREPPLHVSKIARCSKCFGYINPYCSFEYRRYIALEFYKYFCDIFLSVGCVQYVMNGTYSLQLVTVHDTLVPRRALLSLICRSWNTKYLQTLCCNLFLFYVVFFL